MYALDDGMDEYMTLVRAFPLISIRDDAHLAQAVTTIHNLLDTPVRSEGQEAYLGALTDLVETYEQAHVDIPDASGLEVLKFLMEEHGLKQADLLDVFGTRSVASAVYNCTRPIGLTHARRLGERFKLPPDVFLTPVQSRR